MTDEEMATEADRVLMRYARNEKVIVCLSGRLSAISQTLKDLVKVSGDNQASGESQEALRVVADHDLKHDVERLTDALSKRETLRTVMLSHGHSHMLR